MTLSLLICEETFISLTYVQIDYSADLLLFCGTSSYTPYTRDKMLSSRMGFSMTSWKIGNGYMSRLSSHDSSHSRLFTLITILIEIDDHRMFPTWPTATSTFTCSAHWVACCSHWWWLWGKFCHCSINMRTFLVSLTSLATSLTNFCIIINFISYESVLLPLPV